MSDVPPDAHPFWTHLAALRALYEERKGLYTQAQAAYEAELVAKANALRGKRGKPVKTIEQAKALKVFTDEAWKALFDVHQARMVAALDALEAREKVLKAQLTEAAATVPLGETRTVWALYGARSTDTYRSQGWGAMSYARASAQIEVEDLARIGYEARLDWKPFTEGREGGVFEIRVCVAEERETEVLLRRSQGRMNIREYARACWRNGVNPRVYLPGLPHHPDYDP